MDCGEKIKQKRKELNLTQKDLADKVNLAFGTISKYEKNEISIPANKLKEIANVLNVSVDYLLGDTTIANPQTYLEEKLETYYLTENEYDLIINDIINNERIDLSILNSNQKNMEKVKQAYCEVFNIYINYLENSPLDATINMNDKNIKDYIRPIDIKFIEMLKSINKNKVIHKNDSNAISTIDIPKKYPVLGKISAGLPILAVENIEYYSYAPSSKIQEDYDYFFLRVQGDSMNMEFPDGCLLLVQKQPTLEKGQIGVFRINGDDATVKRLQEENGFILLEPRSTNPIHKTQTYDPQKVKVEIIGKVISYIGDVN